MRGLVGVVGDVHVAQVGHGRTGLFAAALLLHSGATNSIDECLAILKAARPGIRLNRAQRKCLERMLMESER